MPVQTISEARDLIQNHFTQSWNTTDWDNVFGVLSSPVPRIRYEDVKWAEPTGDDNWVWLSVRHSDEPSRQRNVGQANGRRFRRYGIVTVQVFTPLGQGLKNNDLLVNVAQGIFEGRSAGDDTIEFLSTSVKEVGESGSWYQTNVSAVFTYDTVR